MNTQQLIAELTEIEEDVRWGLINNAIERLIRLKHKLTKEDENNERFRVADRFSEIT